MKTVRVDRAGGNFELVEQPMPEPTRGCVRIKVQACGVCHSDSLSKDGGIPGIVYPRAGTRDCRCDRRSWRGRRYMETGRSGRSRMVWRALRDL